MDFLKKAKAQLKELEGDLNKATASLGLGDKKEESSGGSAAQAPMAAAPEASSSCSTPSASNVNTPSTSVAPSTVPDAPKTKLPMAIRKNVRDEFEVKIPELEANLSSVMGCPWKTSIDPGYIYSLADERYAKENPGQMITKYVEEATNGIRAYVEHYGRDGLTELNHLCSTHIMTLEPATNPKISYCGTEIRDSRLCLVFKKCQIAVNMRDICAEIATTVNQAGVASAGAGGATALDFDAKRAIKTDYEPAIGEVQARIQAALNAPVMTLHPNFEANFAKIAAYAATGKQSTMYPRDWQKRIGQHTLSYFQAFAKSLEDNGFPEDEMLQDGFKEDVERNEVSLRVVDKMVKGNYNECHIEGGVCYMQTTPEMWTSNIRDVGEKIVDLL